MTHTTIASSATNTSKGVAVQLEGVGRVQFGAKSGSHVEIRGLPIEELIVGVVHVVAIRWG